MQSTTCTSVWRGVHGLAQILTGSVTASPRRRHQLSSTRNIDDSQRALQARLADRFSMLTTVNLRPGRGSSASVVDSAQKFLWPRIKQQMGSLRAFLWVPTCKQQAKSQAPASAIGAQLELIHTDADDLGRSARPHMKHNSYAPVRAIWRNMICLEARCSQPPSCLLMPATAPLANACSFVALDLEPPYRSRAPRHATYIVIGSAPKQSARKRRV